jgi:signal transduction histidine kinase
MPDEKPRAHPNESLNLFLAVLLFLVTTALAALIVLTFNQGLFALRSVALAVLGATAGSVGAVLVFRNSRRLRFLNLRARELQAFCEAIKRATTTLELQEVLDTSAGVIVEVTGVAGCSISLLDARTGKMQTRSLVGVKESAAAEAIDSRDLAEGRPIIIKDIQQRAFPEVDDQAESLLCVPLRLEKVLGAICIYGEQGQRLPPEMISILSLLGDVVSLAIAHSFVYEDLKQLVEAKTRFMLQTSHELRSPLNAIQSIGDTILGEYAGPLGEKQRELISRIVVRAKNLSDTVNDMLALAKGRVELATLKPVRVPLARLVREAAGFYQDQAKEKRVSLEVRCVLSEAPVLGNEEGLRSILGNLISNAVKYTPGGGSVVISLAEDAGSLVLETIDSGIGIPKTEQGRLFTEFFRASNARTACETGTGLGLMIVKSKVEQHGGSIQIESREGRGTTVRIRLPGILEDATGR